MNKKIPFDFVSTQREIIAECAHIRSTTKKRSGAIRIWRKEKPVNEVRSLHSRTRQRNQNVLKRGRKKKKKRAHPITDLLIKIEIFFFLQILKERMKKCIWNEHEISLLDFVCSFILHLLKEGGDWAAVFHHHHHYGRHSWARARTRSRERWSSSNGVVAAAAILPWQFQLFFFFFQLIMCFLRLFPL